MGQKPFQSNMNTMSHNQYLLDQSLDLRKHYKSSCARDLEKVPVSAAST